MNTNKKNAKKSAMIGAAIAGIVGIAGGFGATMAAAPLANADEGKGHCIGANGCKGKSGCSTADNGCAGQNGCKGKGYLETTKAECDKMMKKNKGVKFEVPGAHKEDKKTGT